MRYIFPGVVVEPCVVIQRRCKAVCVADEDVMDDESDADLSDDEEDTEEVPVKTKVQLTSVRLFSSVC
jgi:hypothetical protein